MLEPCPAPVWRHVSAIVPGVAHLADGTPCQDRLVAEAIHTSAGEWLMIAAVADGAGSAACAEQAAQAAVDGFIDCVIHSLGNRRLAELPEAVLQDWLAAMQASVREEAAAAGQGEEDYLCTLLAAAVGEDAGLFLQIGDGVIAIRLAGAEAWTAACLPQRGEYFNQTSFLIDAGARDRAQLRRIAGRIDRLAVTSDGLEGLCLDRDGGQPFSPFFDALLATIAAAPPGDEAELAPGLARFLDSEAVNARTHDDKSLVLAIRREGAQA